LLCFINLVPVIGLGGVGATQECKDGEDAPAQATSAGSAVLAIVHIAFAFYFQYRLLKGLQNMENPSATELARQAGEILWTDIGFCIYSIIFLLGFGLNCAGINFASVCSNSMGAVAAALSLLFAFLAFHFIIFWFCCLSCCYGPVSTIIQAHKVNVGGGGGQKHGGSGAPPPMVVGTPVAQPAPQQQPMKKSQAPPPSQASAPPPSGGGGGGGSGGGGSGSQAASLAQVGLSVAGQFAGKLLQGGQQKK